MALTATTILRSARERERVRLRPLDKPVAWVQRQTGIQDEIVGDLRGGAVPTPLREALLALCGPLHAGSSEAAVDGCAAEAVDECCAVGPRV